MEPTLRHELAVSATCPQLAVVQHENLVRIHHGAQAVSDGDGGSAGPQYPQGAPLTVMRPRCGS